MDLEVQDVSELLHVPGETLLQWIDEGKIPAYLIQNHYRFNREEIENWLIENPDVPQMGERSNYNLYRALLKGDVYNDIVGTTKEEIILSACERIAKKLNLDPDTLSSLILDRENLMTTAVGEGFAIPHARDFYLDRPHDFIYCVHLPKPTDWGALDGVPVSTLFFLFASSDKRHLALLAKLAHCIASADMQKLLRARPGKRVILEEIKRLEAAMRVI
jgi:PTS system nitrogen regulatory IIA component